MTPSGNKIIVLAESLKACVAYRLGRRLARALLVVLALMVCVPVTGNTRKELQNLKSYVKASNFAQGRQVVARCLQDSTINTDMRLYDLAIMLEKKANDAENMKLYLNQKYDTAAFFNSISEMFRFAGIQDSICLSTVHKQTQAHKWEKQRHRSRELMRAYYPNLYSGGIFFVKNKNYPSAMKLLSQYITLPETPLWAGVLKADRVRLPRAAFWYVTSSLEQKQWNETFRFAQLAETDTANIALVLQAEAQALEQKGDSSGYMQALKRGLNESPSPEFFFSRLTDQYNAHGDFMASKLLCDSLLEHDKSNTLYLYARTIALFNLKYYDECISNTQLLLEADSTVSEAYCYLGLSWYNKGLLLDERLTPDPTSSAYRKKKQEVNAMFTHAMPWLEKYKAVAPKETSRWEAPLYRIYFSLNMADKLKSVEK